MLKVAEVLKKPVSILAAKAVLNDFYDRIYGICDHAQVSLQDPLSSIGYHPLEDVEKDSSKRMYITRFRKSRIHERFGLSLKEFFECTRNDAEELLRQADLEMMQQSKAHLNMGDLEKELRGR